MPLQTEIKIAVAQMEVTPGDPEKNVEKIIDLIREAVKRGDELIVFPEMCVSGYLLGDEWENEAFVKDLYNYNEAIIAASPDIAVVWGNVDIDEQKVNEDGRMRKYNAAFIAQNGKLAGKTHKTLLPNYREFDDARHFYSLRKEARDAKKEVADLLQPIRLKIRGVGVKAGLILCEDMWSDDYTVSPVRILLDHEADLIVNVSCSPWTWRKNDKRHRVIRDRLKEHPVPFIYANNVGIQNNGKNIYLFDGASTVYNSDGSLLKMANPYSEQIIRATVSGGIAERLPSPPAATRESDLHELYQGLIFGVRKFFENFSRPKVAIGISGGIDSTLSAVILAQALGPENVYGVNMPSRFNSRQTISAARELAQNLHIHYTSIPIQESYQYTVRQLNAAVFERLDGSGVKTPVTLSGLNEENVQARDRGGRVMAGVASALGAVFVNNGNKTEIAIGYVTLYGDVNGALSIIGDLYKTQVYQLARYINEITGWPLIPEVTLTLPASAELSAAQNVDEGKGDPIHYPYHDQLIKAFVEYRLDPEDLLGLYLEGKLAERLDVDNNYFTRIFPGAKAFIDDLEHKWRLFKLSYFKRIQAPPVITVSKRAFGFDLREAQNGVYFTRNYRRLKASALS